VRARPDLKTETVNLKTKTKTLGAKTATVKFRLQDESKIVTLLTFMTNEQTQ